MAKRNDLIFDPEQFPSIKKFDGQRVHPDDLRPDPVLNGRVELPDIAKFEADFLNPNVGQIQAITIAKLDGMPTIIDGVTRWRAAKKITEEKTGPHEGGAFFLKCTYSPARTAFDRYILTVKANIRNDPKPADIAHTIAIFLHQFQQSEEFIAGEVYGRYALDGKPDVEWVRECNALNDLAPEAIEAIKTGRIKSKAAVALSKLTPERQRQKLAALPEGQKLTVAAIKRADPVAPASRYPEASPARPVKRVWDLGEFRKLLRRYLEVHIHGIKAEAEIRDILEEIEVALDAPPEA